MRPTRDGNGSCWVLYGTGITNNVVWEWEIMGSTRNGNGNGNRNFNGNGSGNGNLNGNGNGNGDLNGNGNGNGNLNGNEDANRRDKCSMGARIQKSGACYMGLMALARERYRSAHRCIARELGDLCLVGKDDDNIMLCIPTKGTQVYLSGTYHTCILIFSLAEQETCKCPIDNDDHF